MRAVPQPNLRLPLEVVGVVAEFLLGSYHFGTLAKLNRTCKAIRAETLPVLYETLTWDNEFHAKQREWWIEVFQGSTGQGGIKFPEGWKWVSTYSRQITYPPCSDWLSATCKPRISVPRDQAEAIIRQAHHVGIHATTNLSGDEVPDLS